LFVSLFLILLDMEVSLTRIAPVYTFLNFPENFRADFFTFLRVTDYVLSLPLAFVSGIFKLACDEQKGPEGGTFSS